MQLFGTDYRIRRICRGRKYTDCESSQRNKQGMV